MDDTKNKLNYKNDTKFNTLELFTKVTWEEYFMSLALLSAKRSSDPNTQVGACIVDSDNKVVSIGYNGMPRYCDDDLLSWNKNTGLDNKELYVCHAEFNAILNTSDPKRLKGGKIYVTLFPCNDCAKAIIQTGIKEVIYLADTKTDRLYNQASKKLLSVAGVKVRQYSGRFNSITLN